MIQLPDSAAQTAPRFDWREALQWETILKIAIVIVIALVAYRIITILIRRLLQREIEEEDPLVRRLREQRAQTLASLLGNVALVAIFIVVTLTILDILLDNIAPILASFGILGLAISFGAQSLVKDIISGLFILFENQFGVGDVIRVPPTPVDVVDTIGAGDTVQGALLAWLHDHDALSTKAVRGLDAGAWSAALAYAGAAAAVTCSRAGAEPPFKRELGMT